MKMTPFLMYVMYDLLPESLNVTARAMMGSYILYSDGRTFAIVNEETLWFKGDEATASFYLERGSEKYSYRKEGELVTMNYYLVPEEVLENKEALFEWLDVALSVATLPKKIS